MLYTLEELYNKKEDQTFDRKSARKDPKGLSNHVVAFANADGGTLVIGIEDDSTVTGIDDYQNNINDILRVPFDYCKPSIRITTETIDCVDKDGKPNHLLVISIPQSSELHANQQDDVYYRMGDKSKKLNFDERLQLMYAKALAITRTSRYSVLLLKILIWRLCLNIAKRLDTENLPRNISVRTMTLLLSAYVIIAN
ncbi:MAG: helix-turn-helix domain-containing protein [Oscillospiraceae bacterium]